MKNSIEDYIKELKEENKQKSYDLNNNRIDNPYILNSTQITYNYNLKIIKRLELILNESSKNDILKYGKLCDCVSPDDYEDEKLNLIICRKCTRAV